MPPRAPRRCGRHPVSLRHLPVAVCGEQGFVSPRRLASRRAARHLQAATLIQGRSYTLELLKRSASCNAAPAAACSHSSGIGLAPPRRRKKLTDRWDGHMWPWLCTEAALCGRCMRDRPALHALPHLLS